MLTRLKISLCIRVTLLIIPCFIYLLTIIFTINYNIQKNNEKDDRNSSNGEDKQPLVFTSSHRRLLGISGDTNFTSSQHDKVSVDNNSNNNGSTFVHPEDWNDDDGSQTDLKLTRINKSSDVVRKNSWIILHVFIACYCFWMLAIICDEYFIASIHVFCNKLKIKHELASGMFMAMATSAPELAISFLGTFIVDGDMGIGTIVGSAIFNILMITACCGILTRSVSKIDGYLLTRDCLIYALAIIGLIAVIYDHLIMWHEAALMVTGYAIYLIMMYSIGDTASKKMKIIVHKIKIQFSKVSSQLYYSEDDADGVTEITPLFMRDESIYNQNHNKYSNTKEEFVKLNGEYEKLFDDDCATNPWKLPRKSNLLLFVLKWPITFLLWCTIPDCRRYEKFYVVTFVNCVAWILGASYLMASMIANVDTIMGMIFLGACTSIPEAVSSVIITMKGNADIGINNAISSNIFDILLCLGLPWSARTMIVPFISGKPWITLPSTGITYSAISLLATLFIFYFLFAINRFRLDRKIGVSCLIFYLIFLIFTLLLELNIFTFINISTIPTINGLI